jgi:hypothetical protein
MAIEETTTAPAEKEGVLKQTYREVTQPFKDLFKASRALWGINISYLLEGLTYFGVVGLLVIYSYSWNYIKHVISGSCS